MQATKLNLIANPFGIMAYSLPNISVAMFIHRILRLPRAQQWLLYSVPITQNILAGISCIILFAQCSPTECLWNPSIPARCLSSTVITGYSYSVGGRQMLNINKNAFSRPPLCLTNSHLAFSAFTDTFLAAIPVFAFWRIQLKVKTKIGLCLLMGMTAMLVVSYT